MNSLSLMGMSSTIRWAPRVPMEWLRLLYERDGAAIVDEELLDKVGYRLYERCRDCLLVSEAADGEVLCPACRDAVAGRTGTELACPACGWTSDWPTFHHSYRHMELTSGGMRPFFERFVRDWASARTPKQKMLAIDAVIHRWHWENVKAERGGVGRPGGVNLIEGSRRQVIALLDDLSSGPNHDGWRALRDEVEERTRAWKASR